MADLYRHFDAKGRLLYVGISLGFVARLQQHKSGSAWYNDISTVTVQKYKTRNSALRAERKAIVKERPIHNKTARKRRPARHAPTLPVIVYYDHPTRLERAIGLAQEFFDNLSPKEIREIEEW